MWNKVYVFSVFFLENSWKRYVLFLMVKVMVIVFVFKIVKYIGIVYMCLFVILGNLKFKGNNIFCVLKIRV